MRSSGQRSSARQAGENEVLLDIEAAEDAPVFLHQLHAGLRDGVALPAGKIDAVERTLPARGVTTPIRLFRVVLLPAPLRPSSATTSLRLDAQPDVEQDVQNRRNSCSDR